MVFNQRDLARKQTSKDESSDTRLMSGYTAKSVTEVLTDPTTSEFIWHQIDTNESPHAKCEMIDLINEYKSKVTNVCYGP